VHTDFGIKVVEREEFKQQQNSVILRNALFHQWPRRV